MKNKILHITFYILHITFFATCNLRHATCNGNVSYYENILKLGNDAYSKGNYDSAIVYYESIINAEYESASLYYNLGNSYYKRKNLPNAILYYERSKKLEPDDSDLSFNLQLANQQITDKIEPLPVLFLTRWWNEIISSASVDSWGKWAIILSFYTMVMFVFFVLSDSILLRKIYFWSGIFGITLMIFSFSFAVRQQSLITKENEAIVFSPSVTTKSSPDENSTNLFVIHEGTKVNILEKVNDWCKISLPDGNIGWMRMEEMRVI